MAVIYICQQCKRHKAVLHIPDLVIPHIITHRLCKPCFEAEFPADPQPPKPTIAAGITVQPIRTAAVAVG